MWSATDYGGFSSTSDYGGGYMASTAGTNVTKKIINQGNVVPCTCAEILAATQEGDRFVSSHGMEFSQVTVFGIVRSVIESATRIEYELDDYTGACVPVKIFIDDQDMNSGQASRPFRELSYVRVHGHVRNVQGIRQIIAFRILPVMDMNELTTHIMDVIYTRMLNAKQKLEETGGSGSKSSHSSNMTSSSAVGATNGLTVIQNQILAIVRIFVGERGIPVSQLCEKLRGIPERQIREDLDFLSAEGHVYSTVDDDHFRATEA